MRFSVKGWPVVFGGVLFSSALIFADYAVGLVQKHFFFVSGWLLLATLLAHGVRLKKRHDQLMANSISSCGDVGGWTLLLVICSTSLVHLHYSLPDGAFEVLLFALLATVVLTGVPTLICRDQLGKKIAGQQNAAVLAAHYQRIYSVHLAFLVATIPVAVFHGILSHAHGALSTLVSKGAS